MNEEKQINSTLSLVNLLDELDWVIGGNGKPTPQFLINLNIFVESFVLNDNFFFPIEDILHIKYTRPFFTNRPILELLAEESIMYSLGKPENSFIENKDIGKVIFVSKENINNKNFEELFFEKYCKKVDKKYIQEIMPFIPMGTFPSKTPILMRYGKKDNKYYHNCVVIFQRNTDKMINNILSDSNLNPILPFYATKVQNEFYHSLQPSFELYKQLSNIHNLKVEKILKYVGFKEISIPPLTSILLSRCKTLEDLPTQLSNIRKEFINLREIGRKHQIAIKNSTTLNEQIELIDEYDEFWNVFNKKIKRKKNRIIYRIWDIIKEDNYSKWFTKSIDEYIEWHDQKKILNRFKGIVDIWDQSTSTPNIIDQLSNIEKLFGCPLKPNEWKNFKLYTKDKQK